MIKVLEIFETPKRHPPALQDSHYYGLAKTKIYTSR
jgi:hypothetical protein